MNKKFFKGIPHTYLPLLALTLWASGKFYPELDLDPATVPFQAITIRILAGFAYSGELRGYWLTVILTFSVYGVVLGFSLLGMPEKILHHARTLILGEFFIQFFYWIFCLKYSPTYFEGIKLDLLAMNLILFAGLIVFSGIFYGISKFSLKKSFSAKEKAVSTAKFECPYCHKEYRSVVSYCIACKKHILRDGMKR